MKALGNTIKAYIDMDSDTDDILIGNGRVEFKLDKKTGYMKSIYSKELDYYFKTGRLGNHPFKIQINGKTIAMTADTCNQISHYEVSCLNSNTMKLDVRYDNLRSIDNTSTGLSTVVSYTIGGMDAYVKFNIFIDNTNGMGTISSMTLAEGLEYTADALHENENFSYVDWYGGFLKQNPHEVGCGLHGRKDYPAFFIDNVTCGWFDLYSCNHRGIGIAYINKKQLAMTFNFNNAGKGFTVYPCFFHRATGPEKGETFTTDTMIIAAHSGDWHSMADIYRTEYEKAFVDEYKNPDYLRWEDIPEKARNIDYIHHANIMDNGKLNNPFLKIPESMQEQADWYYNTENAGLDHAMLWFYGQNAHKGYAADVPVQVPCNTEAGGSDGCKAMGEKLQAKGALVLHYNHPYAYDPAGTGYVREIDPDQHYEYWNGVTHHACCIDNAYVTNLWKNQIIPDFAALGAEGMQFDQGSLLQTICNELGHYHTLMGVSRLSSHIIAVDRLAKMVRDNLIDGGKGVVLSEGANDMTTRHCDFWQVRDDMNPDSHPEMRTYTFPQYRGVYGKSNPMRTICLGGVEMINDSNKPWDQQGKYQWQREYIQLKKLLRDANAPGYPYGFRDDIGLSVGDSNIYAKVFKEGDRLTVVCYAKEDVVSYIDVDKSILGIESGKTTRIDVTLTKGKGTFYIIH